MAATESKMVDLGTLAPYFELPNPIDGKKYSLDILKSEKATVVMFICNHCPYVVHIADVISRISDEFIPKGVSFIAINSNDVKNYPADSPEKMVKFASMYNFQFPYLFDETQDVAKAYGAVCTPDIFVYNGKLELVYRGQFDASRPGNNIPVTGNSLRNALLDILELGVVNTLQVPGIGCNIKWK